MGRIDLDREVEDMEDHFSTRTWLAVLAMSTHLVHTRLAANCDLAGRNPNLNRSFLESSHVSAHPEAIADCHSSTAERTYQFALRLTPILQFVPGRTTTTRKDCVGAAGHGFLHPSRLLVGGYDRQLHSFACP
jgi:hypothetical protein